MKHTNHVIASERLGKDINVRIYGTAGYPFVAFPTQDQMADEWESNGMLDVFAPYIDANRVQLFTVDSNDLESWSNPSDDYASRIARQEDYYDFVCDELVPFVHETNGSMYRPELAGCSLGATQATICALRRPDLFQGAIALSGMYHTSYFFGDWGNDVSYANDVNAFLPNTPADHPYLELYRQRSFAFSIGQAADEQFGVSDLHFLQQTFQKLGIDGWFDFWGPECNHDWYWWKQQMAKFLPEAVKELEGVAASEPQLAKLPAKKSVTSAKKAEPAHATKVSKAAVAPSKAKVETKGDKKPTVARKQPTKGAVKATPQQAKVVEPKPVEEKAPETAMPKAPQSKPQVTQAKAKATTGKATPKTAATATSKAEPKTTAKPAAKKTTAPASKTAPAKKATASAKKVESKTTAAVSKASATTTKATKATKATTRTSARKTTTRRATAKKSAK